MRHGIHRVWRVLFYFLQWWVLKRKTSLADYVIKVENSYYVVYWDAVRSSLYSILQKALNHSSEKKIQKTMKINIHLFARYMKQVFIYIWKYRGTVQSPIRNTIYPGLAVWGQHFFAHRVNLHQPPPSEGISPPGLVHSISWAVSGRKWALLRGRSVLASWDRVRAQLWRGVILCAWLCSSYALIKDKLTLIPQKNKQSHQ